MRAVVKTHRRRDGGSADALSELVHAARRAGATLVFDAEEVRKHGIERGEGIELVETHDTDVDLCIVLGGDGTILTGLRDFAGTGVPVFAINFGEVGFLATLDPDGLGEDFDRAFAGDFERLELPPSRSGAPTAAGPPSTTSPSTASRGCASPTSPTAWRGRRSGACAATGSSSPPRRARPATTSPTAARSWPGACAASSSPSSPRTR
jgi:hypothetical protein